MVKEIVGAPADALTINKLSPSKLKSSPSVPIVSILGCAAVVTVPAVVAVSAFPVKSPVTSPVTSPAILPGTVTTELAPYPIVASISLFSLPPINIKPGPFPPSSFATPSLNCPDS